MAKKRKPINWVDKQGNPISYSKEIMTRKKLFVGMIKKFFPLMRFDEASMALDDLISECQYEAMMALTNFDPTMALTLVTKQADRKKRSDEDHLRWKRENPEEALALAKDQWISRRLYNFLRRIQYERGSSFKGGKTTSYQSILAKANKVLDFEGAEGGLFSVDSPDSDEFAFEDHSLNVIQKDLNVDQAETDRDHFIEVLAEQGSEAFQGELKKLAKEDPARYENLLEFLNSAVKSARKAFSGMSDGDQEGEKVKSNEDEPSDDDAA